MKPYVALLRGINVGGNKLVPMAKLRAALDAEGYEDPRTLLQSGNVVLGASARAAPALERALEELIAREIGVECDVIVRSATEWRKIIASNPFPAEGADHPSHLLVMPMKTGPGAAGVERLRESIAGRERIELVGRDLYIDYPDGIGTSKLSGAVIEKTLGVRGTARNWNTAMKLQALLGD